MTVSAKLYPQFTQNSWTGKINLTGTTVKAMLLSSYTYASTHGTVADVKAAGTEASGTGYTAGGVAVTTPTVNTSGNVTTFDCDDPSWATSTVTAAYIVFYQDGADDAHRYVIAYNDFGGAQSSNAGTFTFTVNAAGVAQNTSS